MMVRPKSLPKICRLQPNDTFFSALAALLLIAAFAKARIALSVDQFIPTTFIPTRLTGLLVSQGELALATFLLCAESGRVKAIAAGAMWTIFCGVAAIEWLGDATACGCFGRWSPTPAVIFAFDVCCLILIIRQGVLYRSHGHSPLRTRSLTSALIGTAVCASIILWGAFYHYSRTATQMPTHYATLKFESWTGQKVPFKKVLGLELPQGDGALTLLFYRFNCPECSQAVRLCLEHDRAQSGALQPRTIFVAVPPLASSQTEDALVDNKDIERVVLPADREWIVTTPVAVVVRDGTAIAVLRGLDQIRAELKQLDGLSRGVKQIPVQPFD